MNANVQQLLSTSTLFSHLHNLHFQLHMRSENATAAELQEQTLIQMLQQNLRTCL